MATDKIEVEKLSVIKGREGRNLDTLVDENTLITGETSAGVFGVFKFFEGIKAFFKGITALGTLAKTNKIPVLQDDGSLKFTTPADITSGLASTSDVNNALANYASKRKLTFSSSSVSFYKIGEFSDQTNFMIKGSLHYDKTSTRGIFDLICTTNGFEGNYENTLSDFGIYIYKDTKNKYSVYFKGFNWAWIEYICNKNITPIKLTETPTGDLISSLLNTTQTDIFINNALADYQKAKYIAINNGLSATFNWKQAYHLICSNKYANKKGEYMGDVSSTSSPTVFTEIQGVTITSTSGGVTVEKTATIENNSGSVILCIVNYF